MKFGTLTTIVMNTEGLLSGMTLYFLLTGKFDLSLLTGIITAIIGNSYGLWLRNNLKKIIWDFAKEVMKPDREEEEKVLSILDSIKK